VTCGVGVRVLRYGHGTGCNGRPWVSTAVRRWAEFAWNGTGYNQRTPFSFDGDAPVFHSLGSWRLDARSGRWGVGADNTFVLNPEFEADRIPVSSATGWDTTVGADSPSTRFVSDPAPARTEHTTR